MDFFGLGEPDVHHVLIVLHKSQLLRKLGVEVVLALREEVHFLDHRGSVTGSTFSETVVGLVVDAQVVVECALARRGAVRRSQAAGVVRDVGVTTTAVVDVNYRLRMDDAQTVGRALLLGNEGAYQVTVKLTNGRFTTAREQNSNACAYRFPRSCEAVSLDKNRRYLSKYMDHVLFRQGSRTGPLLAGKSLLSMNWTACCSGQ